MTGSLRNESEFPPTEQGRLLLMTEGVSASVKEQVTQIHLSSHADSQGLSTSQQIPDPSRMRTDKAVSSI